MARILDWLMQKGALRHWRRAAGNAAHAPLASLRRQHAQARALTDQLDRLIRVAETRLAKSAGDAAPVETPHGTDWSWRPDPWRVPLPVPGMAAAPDKSRLGNSVTVFHDCQMPELSLRQIRNPPDRAAAPMGLQLDVYRFDASFLSLAIDLPPDAAEGLSRLHLVRLDLTAEAEWPLTLFARLNIRHGPNTEKLVQELPAPCEAAHVEFDLVHSNLNEKRVDRLWLDLILDDPAMNQIILRDLTLTRRRRAAL